ncbi:lipase, class 3 [Psychromonas ingrahamii 37]|uniref:Lipase, class 3 n=1 Tax=Psychromonas ingrahamii (strain DSM 17664 / CCUG 51855 / 37) TaxID=357804 RepID=A1SW03_PSYIN|nr:lipase family protein [Psychromonas ingrahamii]ABM03668.1 lipase, class 3 [Psychromonas ingrahamii 37]
MPHKFTMDHSLLEPPIKRAAYSDRTAWLMAVMSSLAYIRFEQPTPLDELAKVLSRETNERNILTKLNALLAAENRDQLKKELKSDLQDIGFELVDTYNISIPLVVDTQAYLAKITLQDRDPMLVLAFRGTEVTNAADIRSDVSANPMNIGPKEEGHQVHSGFYNAFKAAQSVIELSLNKPELKNMPLYITGHSLGGALAVVATYCISNDSVGACYTFGGPRVGNMLFGQSIRTPVYRVINAADLVPRLPPSYLIEGITLLLRWLPIIPYNNQVADYLERFRHYRHYGDLRYLTDATRSTPEGEGMLAAYPGLQVIANPCQLSRWIWLCSRLIATYGRAGINDHSIDIYVEKLAYWGIQRNLGKPKLVSAQAETKGSTQ